jgi:mercuric ion transport protein
MTSQRNATERPATERPADGSADKKEGWLGLVVAGSIIGAVAASACCILPLLLFAAGVGGAWVANLTAFAPYQPYVVVLTLGLLGYGFWRVYRQPACAQRDACPRPLSDRLLKGGLWVATLCIAAALAFPFVARALLGT